MIRSAVPGDQRDRARVPGRDVAGDLEGDRHGGDVRRAHGEAVHLRVAEQGEVDLRADVGGGRRGRGPRSSGTDSAAGCSESGASIRAMIPAWSSTCGCADGAVMRSVSRSGPRGSRSVPRHRGVDLARPGVDARRRARRRGSPASASSRRAVSARMPWWQTMTSGSRGQPRRHPGRIGLDDAERHEQRAGESTMSASHGSRTSRRVIGSPAIRPGVQLGGATSVSRRRRRTGRSRSAP